MAISVRPKPGCGPYSTECVMGSLRRVFSLYNRSDRQRRDCSAIHDQKETKERRDLESFYAHHSVRRRP